jgi:hypothetical protein
MKYLSLFLICIYGVLTLGCQSKGEEGNKIIRNHLPTEEVSRRLQQYVPVEINYDDSALSEGDKAALLKLVQAAKLMDEIFLRQVYSKNPQIHKALVGSDNPDYVVLHDYFDINFGPFDRLNGDEPFINTDEQKPAGANYYPEDMTKEEFENWIAEHPNDAEAFRSFFTVIRRDGEKLVAIPYSQAYREFLEPAAKLLKEAAQLTTNSSLQTYLNSRADAFLSNDYFQSDMDWMDLKDHDIEIVIGPYETYEDKLFGYKAAFESFITLVDKDASHKLKAVGQYLDALEKRLPIPDVHKNFNRGSESPIKVVNEVFTAGDTKAGVQTIAFNLPNDERVREAKGSKKVMLRNVSEAKYNAISRRIMARVMDDADVKRASFDAFFYHVLLHEMVHGIGPGTIQKNGVTTTVSRELKETYSTLEEAKADIVGLYQFPFMVEKGVFSKEMGDAVYASFVGGIFRSVRFGIEEAHGGGNVIILNYLQEKNGVVYDLKTGKFRVNYAKIADAVKALSHDILMIQALGDYDGAKKFIEKYRYISPELQSALERLADIPVDIKPVYHIEKELRSLQR